MARIPLIGRGTVLWHFAILHHLLFTLQLFLGSPLQCPKAQKWGPGPSPNGCSSPVDPNHRPPSAIEQWFTRAMFDDLLPFANLGWGPDRCFPYSYESFVIAARYLPRFGTESPEGNGLSRTENERRDVAAFFAHAIQETGMNDISLYQSLTNQSEADACFYRGGLFNWFEGGPVSAFLDSNFPGYRPAEGAKCLSNGRYCSPSTFFPCANGTSGDGQFFNSCYFGRGAIQISYNYNYAQFQKWLHNHNISVDLLNEPNLVLTKTDPPLALLASLWFYMTPQPPKPSMHDIIIGQWEAGPTNRAAGFSGPIFGPTSLVINNECSGEDPVTPGGGGENRRIRAFKWLCKYLEVSAGNQTTLTCKKMPRHFDQIPHNVSWQPDWSSSWRDEPCRCVPASYGGAIPYFQPGFYPSQFVDQNEANKAQCQILLYENPQIFGMDPKNSACLNHTMPGEGAEVPEGTTTITANLSKMPMGTVNYLRPNLSMIALGTLPDDKKVFVKLPKKKGLRPVFVTLHTLEAPYLYLDELNKIRSVETEAMRNFLITKLQEEAEEKLSQSRLTGKLNLAARNLFFTIPNPPIDRSHNFIVTHGEIRFSAEIFEHCNDHLLVDGHPRCIFFYISVDDDDEQAGKQDCLHWLIMGRPPTQLVIQQLNGVETYAWREAKGKTTLMEQDKWESGTRKNKKPTQ
uniref:Glycoside hydrolase family 19 catalytic domain-containing protein n=1 Tax=Globodera rostochiensis TaxID=31243 RepID=A0A914HHI5_GLORO